MRIASVFQALASAQLSRQAASDRFMIARIAASRSFYVGLPQGRRLHETRRLRTV
jgi:hypothetical protein